MANKKKEKLRIVLCFFYPFLICLLNAFRLAIGTLMTCLTSELFVLGYNKLSHIARMQNTPNELHPLIEFQIKSEWIFTNRTEIEPNNEKKERKNNNIQPKNKFEN